MNFRDDFTQKTKDILAKRVGYICSNPNCMRMTVGPKQGEADSALSLGQAAHITAASVGGPKYDKTLTTQERKSVNNGLWLCYSCATLIDRGELYYTKELLHSWKESAEKKHLMQLPNLFFLRLGIIRILYHILTKAFLVCLLVWIIKFLNLKN